jgi:hypothetical protein
MAVGTIAGRKTPRLEVPCNVRIPVELAKALTAARDDFSLNAATVCTAGHRRGHRLVVAPGDTNFGLVGGRERP